MDFIAALTIFVAILNFLLGILVLLKNPRERLSQLFAFSSIVTSAWLVVNLLIVATPNYEWGVFWLEAAYAFGSLMPVTNILWMFELCGKKMNKVVKYLIISVSTASFFLCFKQGLIIGEVKRLSTGGFEEMTMGKMFPVFAFCAISILIYMIYALSLTFARSKDRELKNKILYVAVGTLLYITTVIIVDFILPFFKIYKFIPLDSPSSFFLVFFTTLAITKYHLFDVKVILTELLVAAIALLLLFNIIAPVSYLFLKIITFFLFLITGYYIINAAHKEIKAKETLEQEVQKRTKELEQSKKIAEERASELEKWYKLTIGRELRMAELKDKIKDMEIKNPRI